MSLKTAALLALIGMALLTILLAVDFIDLVLGVMRGFVPAMALVRSLIHLLAGLTVTVFFFAFQKGQS